MRKKTAKRLRKEAMAVIPKNLFQVKSFYPTGLPDKHGRFSFYRPAYHPIKNFIRNYRKGYTRILEKNE